MIKALIVEDEVLARLGLHQLVNWSDLGFELLEDARDGIEAIERVKQERPQLVLLDLNLPKVNGMEVQKYISSILPDCYVVVVSCSEDFAIVKDVMRQGAFDFLRKLNLTGEELARVLSKCRMEIENETSRKPYDAYSQFLRYEDMVAAHGSLFSQEVAFSGMACVVSPGQPEQKITELARQCKQSLLEAGLESQAFLRGEKCFYLLLKQWPEAFDFSLWRDSIALRTEQTFYIGLTRTLIQSYRAMVQAAAVCEQILLKAYYSEEPMLAVYTQRLTNPGQDVFDFSEDRARFQNALHTMNEDELLWAVTMLFKHIHQTRPMSINVLHRVFLDVLSLYSTTAQQLGHTLEEIVIEGSVSHYQTILTLPQLTLVYQWFESFSHEFVSSFYIPYKSSKSDILRKALEYVEAHLLEPIQLCVAARAINVSETYLSSLFKKEMGQNFISYIHHRKIQKAKEMLAQGRLVKEVSDQLGYENSTYFSKVFKKEVGSAPDVWRRMNQNGDMRES